MTKKADLKRAKNEKEGKQMFTNPPKQEKDQKRKKEKGCLPNLKSRRGIEKKERKRKFTNPPKQEAATGLPSRQLAFQRDWCSCRW